MKKKVLVELRYANDNAFCRSYMCNENELPKVGDKIFLLVSDGTVVSLNKVNDDHYLGKVLEGLPNEEWVVTTIKHLNHKNNGLQ